MAITPYLAMTAAEFAGCDTLPPKIAWMACHFSPYSTGLSNLPAVLPEGSLLIVNDSTPIFLHDPQTVAAQLTQLVEQLKCCGVLLDFQREQNDSMLSLVKLLCEALPCPTGVPETLASVTSGPVFLSPCPLCTPLEEYITAWQEREIWLEIALEEAEIKVTENGSSYSHMPRADEHGEGFEDNALHCRYEIQAEAQEVKFTLWRTESDLQGHLQNAQALGISRTIGLYQELKRIL